MKTLLRPLYIFSLRGVNLRGTCPFLLTMLALMSLSATAWAGGSPPAKAPTDLSVSVSAKAAVCAGTSVTLTASGCPTTGSLSWSTNQTGSSITVVPTQTTTYTALCDITTTSVVTTTATSSTVTSTTAASTTALVTTVTTTTATGTVLVNPAIVLTPESFSISCNGGSDGRVLLNATGGTGELTYQFNNQPFAKTNEYGNLKAGIYPVVVKDGLGCLTKTSVEVQQATPLSVSTTITGAKCLGGADGLLEAVASGGAGDYRYFLDSGTPQVSGRFPDLKANTTYTLVIADKKGCVLYKSVLISAPTPFDVKLTMTPTRCAGSADGSVTVAAAGGTGPYQYQLETGAFQSGTQFTGLTARPYEFSVKDANGCVGKQSITVAQPAPLQLGAAAAPVNCFGQFSGSITLTPTGGTGAVTYLLTLTKIPQTSNVFGGLGTGDYTVVGTDANGCTSLVSATVTKSDPLKIQATAVPASCCICPTGSVRLVSTGGTGTKRQYQMIGQAYQPNGQINALRPNTYRFRVADEVGCTDSVVAVVTNGSALTLATASIKDVSCTGSQNGEATVQATGGAMPFTYYWTTERRDTLKARTPTQTGLPEGTYTVSVVDSNRCTTSTAFVTVKAQYPIPFKPVVSRVGSGTLAVDQGAGVQWYVRTGTDPAKPVPDATQPTLVPFQSGQYYVVVTLNGCVSPPSEVISFVLTALSEPGAGLSVRVVPNPVVERLRLEIEQAERSVVRIDLLDASGRSVWQNQLPAFTGKKQTDWPLTGIPTGLYLLRAEAGPRQSVIRIMVQ